MITPVKPQAQQRSRRLRHYLINLVLLLSLLLQAQSCQDLPYRKEAEMPDPIWQRMNRKDKGTIPMPVTPRPTGTSGSTTRTSTTSATLSSARVNRRDRGLASLPQPASLRTNRRDKGVVQNIIPQPQVRMINGMPAEVNIDPFSGLMGFMGPSPSQFAPVVTSSGRAGNEWSVPTLVANPPNVNVTNDESLMNLLRGFGIGSDPGRNTARDVLAERGRLTQRHWDYIYKEYLARMAEHLFDTVPSMGGGGLGTDWWGDGGSMGGGGGGGGYGNPAFNAWMSRLLSWNVNR